MTKTSTVHTEGAHIVYDYEGDGPLLLTIAGGGGDAIRYAPISNLLAEPLFSFSDSAIEIRKMPV